MDPCSKFGVQNRCININYQYGYKFWKSCLKVLQCLSKSQFESSLPRTVHGKKYLASRTLKGNILDPLYTHISSYFCIDKSRIHIMGATCNLIIQIQKHNKIATTSRTTLKSVQYILSFYQSVSLQCQISIKFQVWWWN